MDKTVFTKRLREAMIVANVRVGEIAQETNITRDTVSRIVNGKSRPRKRTARALTTVAMKAINKRLQDKANESKELREAGNALRQAYEDEYIRTKTE